MDIYWKAPGMLKITFWESEIGYLGDVGMGVEIFWIYRPKRSRSLGVRTSLLEGVARLSQLWLDGGHKKQSVCKKTKPRTLQSKPRTRISNPLPDRLPVISIRHGLERGEGKVEAQGTGEERWANVRDHSTMLDNVREPAI